MKAVIFTEGGGKTGFGHVLRCGALKGAFERAGIRTRLVVKWDAGVPRVPGLCRLISADWRNGSAPALAAGSDIALIDSYLAGTKVYAAIARAVKHCLYLDDCARLDYPEGTVINYNAYGPGMRYPRGRGMRYLLGAEYAPLRPEFIPAAGRRLRKDIGKALIIFGGADLAGLAPQVLKFLAAGYPGLQKTVVAGSGASRAALERLKAKNTRLVFNAGAAAVRDLMLDCDIAFTAGGVTLYELARTGTPAIAFCASANQEKNIRAMAKAGALCRAGLRSGRADLRGLKAVLARVAPLKRRRRMSEAGKKIVDGRGAARVAGYARNSISERD